MTTPELVAPSPRPPGSSAYQKLPTDHETYLAYVVAVRDPLNFHLDIYWPQDISERYQNVAHYQYSFLSEELPPVIQERAAYSCHLKGVEIIQTPNDFSNLKEAYILISKRILRAGGWVLVSVSDIDVFNRILVNIFDVITRKSLNQELLEKISSRTNTKIAKQYVRPTRTKTMFNPRGTNHDYHIVYDSKR